MAARRRLRAGLGLLFAAGTGAFLAGLNCHGPLRDAEVLGERARPAADGDLALARRYAPWILKEMHATKGRQDVPAAVDFDGDLRGDNNWEALPRFELLPTVYYAVLASETHWFLTYHLFHPRDWALVDLGVHLTHENDGENLQVVVERASGRVVLLFTQAHYAGGVYANEPGWAGALEPRGPFLLVDDAGRPSPEGTHPVVRVESGGHGIYGVAPGTPLAVAGRVLRPAAPEEPVAEPAPRGEEPVPYRLDSTLARLWPLLRDGALVGAGRLLDGPVPYRDARVAVGVPRYYEADRFSGPFGPDRGISPFAVDVGFEAPHLGALFFDPARRYAELLSVPEPWSLVYRPDPFAPAGD